jgi:hypothetical protein
VGEGELLGDVLQNGVPTTDPGYHITLEPWDSATGQRVGEHWSGEEWVSPNRHGGRSTMFDWIDPRATDGACGNIRDFLLGNYDARGNEVHWNGPTSPPSGKERHCIRPGSYVLTLTKNDTTVRSFRVDYVPERRDSGGSVVIADSAAQEYIEGTDYNDTTYTWEDLWVVFDLQASGGWDVARVRADNGGADPYQNRTFTGDPAPAGGKYDYFRVSSRTSTSSGTGFGRLLSRLYWDAGEHPERGTGYYDSHSQAYGLIRIHQFVEVQQSGTYQLGLETMRPEEPPANSPAVTLGVSISVSQPPPPLVNVVTGPDMVTPSVPTSYDWEQSASGGVPPYTYGTWRYYRYPGPETTVGTGKFLSLVVAPTSTAYVFRLRASVSDSAQTSTTVRYFVEVIPSGRGLLAGGTQGGVRFPDGSCRSRPTEGPARQEWLRWVFESRQGLVETCRLDQ